MHPEHLHVERLFLILEAVNKVAGQNHLAHAFKTEEEQRTFNRYNRVVGAVQRRVYDSYHPCRQYLIGQNQVGYFIRVGLVIIKQGDNLGYDCRNGRQVADVLEKLAGIYHH